MTDLNDAIETICALSEGRERRTGAVRLHRQDGWADLVIDHPEARGALTIHMMLDLAKAVVALHEADEAVLLLRGTDPRSLCSGGHLEEVQAALLSPERGRQMSLAMGAVLDALGALPMVSVAVVQGAAIGGGAELITATDFRVMSTDARVQFVHARLGVAPGWGGASRLVRLVGRRTALRLLAAAEPSMGPQAAEIGLADRVGDDALAEAHAFVRPILALPSAAVRAVKQQVVGAGDPVAQADAFASVWAGADHQEALARVLERLG